MKLLISLLCFFCLPDVYGQVATKANEPIDLQVDYVDGVLVFKPSAACMADSCFTNIGLLKEAITHITVRKPDKKAINSFLPVKIGSTEFYLTIYHYPFSANAPDTILRVENDTIMIHDLGGDGILSDSAREYCIDKRTQQKLDWKKSYATLMQAGVCPVACFMRNLHEHGYKGYLVQIMNDGHSAIMYY